MRRTSSGGGERIAARARARCACSGPADSQPMASDTSTPSMLLTYKRVLQCERVWVAGEARTRAACVTSVLCTCVLVCRVQGSERGRGGGEAEASEARCATCLEIGKSGNREIGKSGNRETASRAYDFLREAWCSCDAAAAECQLRRVIDTLAGLPSAIDTLTGATASRETTRAAIYLQSCRWC